VKDHPAFLKKIDAEGIKLTTPINKNPTTGNITAYITDPVGHAHRNHPAREISARRSSKNGIGMESALSRALHLL
jgi:hypothetical protein